MTKKETDVVKILPQQKEQIITLPQTRIVAINPEELIARAIDQNLPVETMERLLKMRKELKAEAAKEAFDEDMATLQGELPTIKKTKEVRTNAGKKAYSYAPLESIIEQTKNLIKQHNFSYMIKTETMKDEKSLIVGVKSTCIVKHKFGHSEESQMEVPLGNKTDIMSQSQVVAAASTFSKRYAFCNAFGIMTGDEDTDGATPPTNTDKKLESTENLSDFDKAVKLIKQNKNIDYLIEYDEKMSKGKKFSDEEKTKLHSVVSDRVDQLQKIAEGIVCQKCGNEIKQAEADYSFKIFKGHYCRDCQNELRKK